MLAPVPDGEDCRRYCDYQADDGHDCLDGDLHGRREGGDQVVNGGELSQPVLRLRDENGSG